MSQRFTTLSVATASLVLSAAALDGPRRRSVPCLRSFCLAQEQTPRRRTRESVAPSAALRPPRPPRPCARGHLSRLYGQGRVCTGGCTPRTFPTFLARLLRSTVRIRLCLWSRHAPGRIRTRQANRPEVLGPIRWTTAGYHRGLHQTRLPGTSGTDDASTKRQICSLFAQPRRLPAISIWARLGSNQRPPACEAGALPLSYAPRSLDDTGYASTAISSKRSSSPS